MESTETADDFYQFHKRRISELINKSTCPKCGKRGEIFICKQCVNERNERRAKLLEDRKNGTHQLKKIVASNINRAKKAGLLATLTVSEWKDILEQYGWTCFYCKVKPYAVLEHKIPISKGGGTTSDNCVPSCVECNVSKGSRIIK